MVRTRNCTYTGPSEIGVGNRQQLSIETEVLNGDTSPYEYTLALLVDGQQITSKSGSIGETTRKDESISAQWTAPNSDGLVDVSVEIVNEDQQSSGGGGGGGGGDDDEGGGGSDESETTITGVDISPSDITDGESFTASATVSHNGPDDNVGVVFRVAGRDVATGSRTVSAGTDVIAQDISWSRLTTRGVAPASGQITVPVQAVLDGQTVEAGQQLTLTKGSTGSDPPRNGGGGEETDPGGPELVSVGPTTTSVQAGTDLTLSADVAHTGESEEVTLVWRVDGREISTSTGEIGPGNDPNNDGETTFQNSLSYDLLERRGVVPSTGTNDATIEARLSGTDNWVDWGGTVTIFSTRGGIPQILTARVPGVGDVNVPRESAIYKESGYRSRSPRRRNERERGR